MWLGLSTCFECFQNKLNWIAKLLSVTGNFMPLNNEECTHDDVEEATLDRWHHTDSGKDISSWGSHVAPLQSQPVQCGARWFARVRSHAGKWQGRRFKWEAKLLLWTGETEWKFIFVSSSCAPSLCFFTANCWRNKWRVCVENTLRALCLIESASKHLEGLVLLLILPGFILGLCEWILPHAFVSAE